MVTLVDSVSQPRSATKCPKAALTECGHNGFRLHENNVKRHTDVVKWHTKHTRKVATGPEHTAHTNAALKQLKTHKILHPPVKHKH